MSIFYLIKAQISLNIYIKYEVLGMVSYKIFEGFIGNKIELASLVNYINRFINSNDYEKIGINAPRCILIYGGSGKTFILNKLFNELPIPCFEVKKEGKSTYSKSMDYITLISSDCEKRVILIDDFDKVIKEEEDFENRIFKMVTDENNKNTLVIATLTDFHSISSVWSNFEFLIKIIKLSALRRSYFVEEAFNDILNKLGVKCDNIIREFYDEFKSKTYNQLNNFLKALVVNNGKDNFTEDTIRKSLFYKFVLEVDNNYKFTNFFNSTNFNIAYYGAGVSLVAYRYREYFRLIHVIAGRNSYESILEKDMPSSTYSYKELMALIEIKLAGNIAQKLLVGEATSVGYKDLDLASKYAYYLVNKYGYKGCYRTLPTYLERDARKTTEKKRRINEKLSEKILMKAEKKVTKFLKHNKHLLKVIKENIQKKQLMFGSEIENIVCKYKSGNKFLHFIKDLQGF